MHGSGVLSLYFRDLEIKNILCVKDIPLEVENSYKVNSRKSMFTPRQIAEFDKQAKELNAADQGDQSAFLIAVRVTYPGSVGAR